jgi:molybdopterin synthase catalytic subunit
MSGVRVAIVDGPISPGASLLGRADRDADDAVGSRIRFEGVVRRLEDGRSLEAIDYEVYEPMAGRQLEAMAREELAREGILFIGVIHSRGPVAVGEVSFVCEVRSQHRAEGLAALGSFIDRMKVDAAIWKRPIFRDARDG